MVDAKENIKSRILEAAQKAAAEIVAAAESEKENILAEAARDIEIQKAETMAKAEQKAREIKTRREMLLKLNAQKAELRAKQDLVDKIYAEALNSFKALPDAEYRGFFAALTLKYAEDGDEVIIAACDKKRLDAAWFDTLVKRAGIRLTLSAESCDSAGGLIMRGKKYDKKLTAEALLYAARHKTENEAVKILFN